MADEDPSRTLVSGNVAVIDFDKRAVMANIRGGELTGLRRAYPEGIR